MDMSLEENLYSGSMKDYAVSLLLMELSQEHLRSRDSSLTLPPLVISAREWIRDHCYMPFDVSELADALGYRADYLSSVFKRRAFTAR